MTSKAGGFTAGWREVFGDLYSMSVEVPNASTPQARRKKIRVGAARNAEKPGHAGHQVRPYMAGFAG
jgi:hypothetical protein